MENKKVVYEYDDEITYSINRRVLNEAIEAVNIHLVGTNDINIYTTQGVKENPKVSKHPNYGKLTDVHYKMFAGSIIPIKVRIYEDGSREIIPFAK